MHGDFQFTTTSHFFDSSILWYWSHPMRWRSWDNGLRLKYSLLLWIFGTQTSKQSQKYPKAAECAPQRPLQSTLRPDSLNQFKAGASAEILEAESEKCQQKLCVALYGDVSHHLDFGSPLHVDRYRVTKKNCCFSADNDQYFLHVFTWHVVDPSTKPWRQTPLPQVGAHEIQ